MLLQFGVSNYQSIKDRQELSLVATALTDGGVDVLSTPGIKQSVLPAAMIFGANASGKTSVLTGLKLMCDHVRSSHSQGSPGSKIPRRPFLLDEESKSSNTDFDCDFIVENVRYHYGFSFNDDEYTSEWLYAFGVGGKQLWYYRTGPSVKFGKYIRGQNKSISALMRSNSLFLSVAAQNAHSQLTPIFQFFSDAFIFDLSGRADPTSVAIRYKDGVDKRIVDFIKSADAGIVDVEITNQEIESEARGLVNELTALFQKHLPGDSISLPNMTEIPKLRLGHYTGNTESTYLSLNRESKGTIRLLDLMHPAISALDHGLILVVDEIDNSLHTLLSIALVKLFTNKKTNPRGAQLIATTHDTNMLHGKVFRRDQIWFTEKSPEGQTCLYPLTEMSTRKTDNFERGYLQGRFGAVPFLGGIEDSIVTDSETRF